MFHRAMVAGALWVAGLSAALAQNLMVESGGHYALHGTLVRAEAETEDGPVTFPAIELVTPIDVSCASGDELCQPEVSQRLLHLAISDDAAWTAFESGTGQPVQVFGQLYNDHTIHHHTPVLVSVAEIEPLPQLSLRLADGRYADNPAICVSPAGENAPEHFRTASIVGGSLVVSGNEYWCVGTKTKPDGDTDVVAGTCWQEATQSSTSMRLMSAAADAILVDGTLLRACATNAALPDPVYREIDLRPTHADLLYYGSRMGMEVTLLAASGLGTDAARLIVEHTPYNAYRFCALYSRKPTKACIDETLALPLTNLVTGNCSTGVFSDFYGSRFRFEGPSSGGDYPEFVIRDLDQDEVLSESGASGYYTTLAIYEALCATATSRPLFDAQTYDVEFDRLRAWQDKSLFDAGGVATLPITRFASKERPDIGPRVWTQLGNSKLVMHQNFGLATRNGASVLIDFARRDIMLCVTDDSLPSRPVSYRFGTMLAGGLDGFGAPCPVSIEDALAEYQPLVDDDQRLWVSALDEDGFAGDWRMIDRQPDLLGLGGVLYFDQCRADLDFNPEWFNVWKGNWLKQGRFDAGGLLCHVADSQYQPELDALHVDIACATAGYETGATFLSISRTPTGRLTIDDEPVSQCSSHYFDYLAAYNLDVEPTADGMTELPLATMIEWSGRGSRAFLHGETVFSLAYVDGEAEDRSVIVTAYTNGVLNFEAQLAASQSGLGGIGVFPMGEEGTPALVFASYFGGASCCHEIAVVPLTGVGAEVMAIGPFYGDYWEPRDLDGDGSFEFLHGDEAFNYAFGSPSGTYLPPLVHALVKGKMVDATADRRFRRTISEEVAHLSAACGGDDGWAMGACLVWAAISAKLGTYDSAMTIMTNRFRQSAPAGDWRGPRSATTLMREIRLKLEELGYLPA